MTNEQLQKEALYLSGLYCLLIQDRSTARYDVEKHNLCTAVIERKDGLSKTWVAYSNPSGLRVGLRMDYGIISDVLDDEKLIGIGGMADYHTEVRLINYLYASGEINDGNATIYLFSSRSVCNTCKQGIIAARQILEPQNVDIKYYSLKCETELQLDTLYDETEQSNIKFLNL